MGRSLASTQWRLYLHWGPGHPPAERGPSLESICRVSLTVDLCERNKISFFFNLFHHSQLGAPQKENTRGPGHVPGVHWLRRPCVYDCLVRWLPVLTHQIQTGNYSKLATITYKSLSVAPQPTCICYFSSINPLDPFGQVARTCWRCLQWVWQTLSATVHHLFGTSYCYPSDLSAVSTH